MSNNPFPPPRMNKKQKVRITRVLVKDSEVAAVIRWSNQETTIILQSGAEIFYYDENSRYLQKLVDALGDEMISS